MNASWIVLVHHSGRRALQSCGAGNERSWIAARERQLLIRRPLTRTVQAPHWPRSHPFFVPVIPNRSLRASSRLMRGSTVSECCLSLTVKAKWTGSASRSLETKRSSASIIGGRPTAIPPVRAAAVFTKSRRETLQSEISGGSTNSFLIRFMLLMLPPSVQADKHLWVNASILLVNVNIGLAKRLSLRNTTLSANAKCDAIAVVAAHSVEFVLGIDFKPCSNRSEKIYCRAVSRVNGCRVRLLAADRSGTVFVTPLAGVTPFGDFRRR
jgi:hypothetical protein